MFGKKKKQPVSAVHISQNQNLSWEDSASLIHIPDNITDVQRGERKDTIIPQEVR